MDTPNKLTYQVALQGFQNTDIKKEQIKTLTLNSEIAPNKKKLKVDPIVTTLQVELIKIIRDG